MRKVRIILPILSLITFIFLISRILANRLFFKDIWRAIQDTSLELSLTFLLILLLLWWGIEINHRVNKSQTKNEKQDFNLPEWGKVEQKRKKRNHLQVDFWQGISTEMIGAVISTILLGMIVLIFQQYQAIQNRKAELKLQMGSDERVWAIEAVRQLRAEGWITNGTLTDTSFYGADLSGAFLWRANLTNTDLGLTSLIGSVLVGADLRYASLWNSDLSNADLRGANLTYAILSNTNFDEHTVLPDVELARDDSGRPIRDEFGNDIYTSESYWTPETDMARYTNPEHPDYWNPCEELDIVPLYCGAE